MYSEVGWEGVIIYSKASNLEAEQKNVSINNSVANNDKETYIYDVHKNVVILRYLARVILE